MRVAAQKLIILIIAAMALSACANAPASNAGIQAKSASVSESSIDDRMITYSVSLRLSVKNIENTQETLITQTKNYNGFIVRESENYLTARIPVVNMDDFVHSAKVLGTVEDETKTGTDITDQYRDNTVRLESLKNVRGRYLSLLEKANTVNDILNIEKELERVNTEIEILEGRIKYAELSVEYSNITIHFKEKTKPGPLGWIFYGVYRGIKWLFVWN
jgi:hypothetical protein